MPRSSWGAGETVLASRFNGRRRKGNQSRSLSYLSLFHHGPHPILHGMHAEVEVLRDFLVGSALNKKSKNLLL